MEFDTESVLRSYRWLGHGNCWTEVYALHPKYRPGRESYHHNRRHRAFPVVWYVRDARQLLKMVRRFHGTRMVCYGINPRPGILRYQSGHLRAHRDPEIEVVKSFYFDLDLREDAGGEELADLEFFLEQVSGKIEGWGFNAPVKAFTGNGFHLLFAIPEVKARECPDIGDRIRLFRERVFAGLEGRLAELSVQIDTTDNICRMAKVYGTAKPDRRVLSRFCGDGKRVEDSRLRDALLEMELLEGGPEDGLDLEAAKDLPASFSRLLESDRKVRLFWMGQGKVVGDLSSSGYDYSLLKECLAKGITDVKELAAIIALRPGGSVSNGTKGEQYVRHTISKAVKDFQWGPE